MTRSRWKHSYIEANVLTLLHSSVKKELGRIWSRRSVILSDFIGHIVRIHTGKTFIPVKVTADMVGHKFGEFAFTRKGRQRRR